MIAQIGDSLVSTALFLKNGAEALGLNVTVDVYKTPPSSGTPAALVIAGTAVEHVHGAYKYLLDGSLVDEPAEYEFIFYTDGDVDQAVVVQGWEVVPWVANIDAPISGISVADIANAVWSYLVAPESTPILTWFSDRFGALVAVLGDPFTGTVAGDLVTINSSLYVASNDILRLRTRPVGGYAGDFKKGAAVVLKMYMGDGAVVTGVPNRQMAVYKDSDTAQSTAYLCTIDFDDVAGLLSVTLPTTDAFFLAGSKYDVHFGPNLSLDGYSLAGAHFGWFTLEMSAAAVLIGAPAGGTIASAVAGVPTAVWAAGERTLTSFGALVSDIWAAANFGTLVDDIWNAATRTLTSGGGGGATAAEVWSYATRVLTSLGTTTVKLASAVLQTGGADIYKGATYDSDDGAVHALQWKSSDPVLGLYTGVATFYLRKKDGTEVLHKVITPTLISGSQYLISCDLTTTETEALSVGKKRYVINVDYVVPVSNYPAEDPGPDHVIPLVVAMMTVKDRTRG